MNVRTLIAGIILIQCCAVPFCHGLSRHAAAFRERADLPWTNRIEETAPAPASWTMPPAAGDLEVITSEYYPGWVMRTGTNQLHLFHRLPEIWRVSGPTRMALSIDGKGKVFTPDQPPAPADLKTMDKPWMLFWFEEAKGWDHFDMPVLVVLQHRPQALTWSQQSVALKYGDRHVGQVAMMNLFGYYKPPQPGATDPGYPDQQRRVNMPEPYSDIGAPFTWNTEIPAALLQRCRLLSRTARAVPVDMDEIFSVDLAADRLILRHQFHYLETEDDWKTRPLKLAPLSPTTALARRYGLPVRVSGHAVNLEYPTPLGPWVGINTDRPLQIEFPLLSYLTETRKLELNMPSTNPVVQFSLHLLTNLTQSFPLQGPAVKYVPELNKRPRDDEKIITQAMLAGEHLFGPPYPAENQKTSNFCWRAMTTDRTKAYAMHFMEGDKLQQARENMRRLFLYSYFNPEGYRTQQVQHMAYAYRNDTAIGGKATEDAGKLVMDSLLTTWLYVYHARDYSWIRQKAPFMEQMAITLALGAWGRGGRLNIAEMGDEAGPALAYARLMYAARDQERFAYGAYASVMEMLHLFVKCGPYGAFSRSWQPWHRLELMHSSENATDVNGDAAGWNTGGPGDKPIDTNMLPGTDVMPYAHHGSGQWSQRWRCMADLDVDRFFSDHCVDKIGGLESEFNLWLSRDFATTGELADYDAVEDPWRNPAKLLSLRYHLLQEPLEQVYQYWTNRNLSTKHLFAASWNYEPAPWLYWALHPRPVYERIMKREHLPWLSAPRSRYPYFPNDMLYSSSHMGRTNAIKDQLLPPFPFINNWTTPARPKGSGWGLGFISADPDHVIQTMVTSGCMTRITYSAETVAPTPPEIPLEGAWAFKLDPLADGINLGYYHPDFPDSSWEKINVPGLWEEQGYDIADNPALPRGVFPEQITANEPPNYVWPYDGTAWYRKEVAIPTTMSDSNLTLHIGMADDFDMVWFNGQLIGQTDAGSTDSWWTETRLYPIPHHVLHKSGTNVIAIMICDNNWGGGIPSGPVRIIAE